jgi:histidine triad (HIT) family protein
MPNGECIFCKIAMKEIPSKIVYEDQESVAFLDINPRSKGMCLVIPKKHFTNFEQNRELASKLFDKAMIVAEKIRRSLNPMAVYMSVMPAQVPHFHIRVYPVYRDQVPLMENKPLEISPEELDDLARRIRLVNVDWKGREKVKIVEKRVEKKEEEPREKRSKEDIDYIKRNMKIA